MIQYKIKKILSICFFLISFILLLNLCLPLYAHHVLKSLGLFFIIFTLNYCIFQNELYFDDNFIEVLIFFIFWLIFGISSLFWTRYPSRVMLYTFRNVNYILIIFIIGQYLTTLKSHHILRVILTVMTLVLVAISLWEITTLCHLATSRFVRKNILSIKPTAVFTNENDLASAFVVFLPIALLYIKESKKVLIKIFYLVLILYICIVILVTGARLALIGSTVLLSVYWLFFITRKSKLITVLIIAIIWGVLFFSFNELYSYLKLAVTSEIVSIYTDSGSIYTSSIEIRLRLFKIGYRFLVDSWMFGLGSGNFSSHMSLVEMVETGGIFNPHNLFLEMTVNNGIFIIFGFIYILIKSMCVYIAHYIKTKSYFAAHYILMGFTFIIASSASSSISGYYLFWIYLAYYLFGYREIKHETN